MCDFARGNGLVAEQGAGEDTPEEILAGIEAIRKQVKNLVVVTNEVFSDGITYDPDTMRYLSYLGAVNQRLAQEADCVTEVVYGIPLELKRPGRKQNGITPAF